MDMGRRQGGGTDWLDQWALPAKEGSKTLTCIVAATGRAVYQFAAQRIMLGDVATTTDPKVF